MQLTVSLDEAKDLKASLQINQKLGSGKFNVYHATARSLNAEFALKVFPKNALSTRIYMREKQIRSLLHHENIINYFPIVNHSLNCNILLTEYAPYGSFLHLVLNHGLHNEKLVRTYFHHLVEGLEYLHSKDVAHMDLKLENLLLGKNFILKINDFDQAQKTRERGQVSAGTMNYRAPEVKEGKCCDSFAADIYSAGVVLFALKTGEFPLAEEQDQLSFEQDLFENDKQEFWKLKAHFHQDDESFGKEFKEIINGMLRRDPCKRFCIKDIKTSAWYNGPIFDKKNLKAEMERIYERIYKNFPNIKA